MRPPSTDARRTAYDVLHEIGASDAYAHIVLPQILKAADLDQRDAAFATDMVNGSLRMRGLLDAVIAHCSSRGLDTLDPRVLDILRLGAYQLLFTRTDAYAAVNTSVDLVQSVVGDAPKGLVNAILRKISQKTQGQWVQIVTKSLGDDPDAALAIRYSHPRWMVCALRDSLGKDRADEIEQLLDTDNKPPRVTLAARPGRSTVEELVDLGGTPGRWSPYAVIAPAGRVGQIEAVRRGRAGVQDEGSQLVAVALANVPLEGTDERWLDLCAGPGGKLALLAALAAERGAAVTGIELHAHRATLVSKTVGEAPGFDGVIVGDARVPQVQPGVDRVLLDAPCTGLGVLRRRPEMRWRRQPSDIPPLTKLQAELLNAAIDAVRPGGVVGYATCSPHIAETDLIIQTAVRKRDDIAVEDARPLFPGVTDLGDGPFVRLWPHVHDTDGMFFALIRKL